MSNKEKPAIIGKVRTGKIPTVLGLFFLLVTLALLYFISETRIFGSRASAQIIPRGANVTNVIDRSLSVSWETQTATTGFIKIFIDGEERIFFDVRDRVSGSSENYYLHYVLVEGLNPSSEYRFQLVSGGKSYNLLGEAENRSTAKTAAIYSGQPPEAKLAFGRVVDSNGEAVSGILVYLDIPGMAPLSSLTSSSGIWVIPLAFAYNAGLSAPANYQEGEVKENISVEGGNMGRSLVVNFTRDNRPVRNIVLGVDSDFTNQDSIKDNELGFNAGQEGGSNFATNGSLYEKEKEFEIISPNDGETVSTLRPEIFGTGPKLGLVKITIESSVAYESSLEIGDSEEWQWTPPGDLELGSHTLTVDYTTPQGEKKSFVRNFVVLAAGDENDPAFMATPSGETTTPTPTPTTVAPSVSPINTPTLSPTPTTDLSRSTMPATDSGVPETGILLPVMTAFVIGSVFLFAGLLRLF